MTTMQEYLTAHYEDDPPKQLKITDYCSYCGGLPTPGNSVQGTLPGGFFHHDCEQKAVREGRLRYKTSDGYPCGSAACEYSEWWDWSRMGSFDR